MAKAKTAPRPRKSKVPAIEAELVMDVAPVGEVVPEKLPPWKSLSPKQKTLMRLCREKTGFKKYIGVFGTRLSGKSIGVINAVVDHMWRTKNASVMMLVGTQGAGSTSGIWNVITEEVIPAWMSHDMNPDRKEGEEAVRMEWGCKGQPRLTAAKKLVCATTNMHGGESKLELDSLDDEKEAEKKFKNRYYTMIVWNEAGEFKSSLTLTTMMMALRGMGRESDDFVLLVDANPPNDGQNHFLYKYFYELRLASESQLWDGVDASDDRQKQQVEDQLAIKQCLHLTEWTMEDNPFLTESEKRSTRGLYASEPELYDRYILGKWNMVARDAIFSDIFKSAIHVFSSPKDPEPMILIPSEGCIELITGHDAGLVNPVTYILEKTIFEHQYQDQKTKQMKTRFISEFKFLDEIERVGKETSVAEFTQMVMERMEFWEKEIGHPIAWHHYADLATTTSKESIAKKTVADETFSESNGLIRLIGVEKGSGSVALRVQFMRRLVFSDRILISGVRCPKLVQTFQGLRKGKVEGTVSPTSVYRHYFDAASYPIMKLCSDEIRAMARSVRSNSRRQNETESENGFVTIPL